MSETRLPERCGAGFKLEALEAVVDLWFAAACDCCSPTELDNELDGLTAEFAVKLQRFGIEVAHTAMWRLDEDRDSSGVA